MPGIWSLRVYRCGVLRLEMCISRAACKAVAVNIADLLLHSGGETVASTGSANQEAGSGGTDGDGQAGKTRRQQGYGEGSGVGA